MTAIRSAFVISGVLIQAVSFAQEPKASPKTLESGINSAFERKNAAAVSNFLASIYNEGGVSRAEVTRQLSALFKAGTVQVNYKVLDFHQFPGKNIGYFRTSTEMSVRGANAAAKDLRTAGYASAINEGGQWRIFATQPAACPRVNNLDVASERGDWSGWGSQINPAGMASGMLPEADRPVFAANFVQDVLDLPGRLGFSPQAPSGPKFDKAEWQRRFESAWNSKNEAELLSFYGADYNEFGLDRAAVADALRGTLARYDKIDCKYRVLGIKYFPGGKLASLKAVVDLRGQPKGSGNMEPILQVAGYASLMAEGREWKIYATQLFTTPQASSNEVKTAASVTDWPPRLETAISR